MPGTATFLSFSLKNWAGCLSPHKSNGALVDHLRNCSCRLLSPGGGRTGKAQSQGRRWERKQEKLSACWFLPSYPLPKPLCFQVVEGTRARGPNSCHIYRIPEEWPGTLPDDHSCYARNVSSLTRQVLLSPPAYGPERRGSACAVHLAHRWSLQGRDMTQILPRSRPSSLLGTLFPRRAGR